MCIVAGWWIYGLYYSYVSWLVDCKRCCIFFFQAEDGIRDLVRSRGLGDVYKRQQLSPNVVEKNVMAFIEKKFDILIATKIIESGIDICLLYTSDAADERSSVDLGGRRIIKKKKSMRR